MEAAPIFHKNFGEDFDEAEKYFDDLKFWEAEHYADIVFAEMFEGNIHQNVDWNDTKLEKVHKILKEVLLRDYPAKAQQVWVTK